MSLKKKSILKASFILISGAMLSAFVYFSSAPQGETNKPYLSFLSGYPFKLGLDLSGGTELIYKADLGEVKPAEQAESLAALRDVIERRVNIFGVSEPVVLTETSELQGESRVLVQLPGVTNIDSAIKMLGETPILVFKTPRPAEETEKILEAISQYASSSAQGGTATLNPLVLQDPYFISSSLTGRYLKKSQITFNAQNTPQVLLSFDEEGAKLFETITRENVGKSIAIYLDGSPISVARVNTPISGGQAVISSEDFTLPEVKTLVGRLNSGALPVPVSLIGTNLVGPSLGQEALESGVSATLMGFLFVSLFLVIWYRLPGLIAITALSFYTAIMLTLFKLIPVTLTAPGIAGFIISIGLAVDANILIFERIKEELSSGATLQDVIKKGFERAWSSIKDSNVASLITAFVLFFTGSSLIQGFALVFGLGVLVSMFSAITVSRVLLLATSFFVKDSFKKFLFGSGFSK